MSAAVATALGWRRTGFGDYLRERITAEGGDPTSREALQDLGQSLVECDPEGFCRSVLAAGGFRAGDAFLIDGVRHVSIYRILAEIAFPSSTRLLFLSADESLRVGRIANRSDSDDFDRAAGHKVEAELRDDLPTIADGIIDASQAFDTVVGACVESIKQWRQL